MIYNFYDEDVASYFLLETDLDKSDIKKLLIEFRKNRGAYVPNDFFDFLKLRGVRFSIAEIDGNIYF